MTVPNLTEKEFQLILLQIVKDMSNPKKQINQFTTVDRHGRPINGSDQSRSYKNYVKNEWWTRDWFASGAHEHEMDKEFPIFGYDYSERSISNIMINEGTDEIYIVVFDQVDCEDCERSEDEVARHCSELLVSVMRELFTYGCYLIDDKLCWLAKERYIKFSNEGLLESDLEPERDIQDFITVLNNKAKKWTGFADDVIGWGTTIYINNCIPPEVDFSYKEVEPVLIFNTKCENC